MTRPQSLVLLLGCGLYGAFRVFAFHPACRPAYHQWLRTTPWSPDRPLPMGPVHLVWQDLVVVAFLTALGAINPYLKLILPPLVFLIAYLLSLCLVFSCTGAHRNSYVFLFGFGLMARFIGHDVAMLVTAIGLYVVGVLGLRRSLAGFPWESQSELKDRPDVHPISHFCNPLTQQMLRTRKAVGWPYEALRRHRPEPIVGFERSVCLSLLAGWFAALACSFTRDFDARVFMGMICGFVPFAGAIFRIALYRAGTAPPISFLGRLLTGRWIIPGWDRIYLVPLAAVALGVAGCICLLAFANAPGELVVFVTVSASTMLLLNAGPTRGRWRLTGHHRITAQTPRPDLLKVG